MRKTQYLQRLGHSWYLRVKIPSSIQGQLGSTHIRRALGTRDLDEAVRRKWDALAQVRAYLDSCRAGPVPVATLSLSPAATPLQGLRTIAGNLQLTANPPLSPTAPSSLDALSERWIEAPDVTKTVRYQRRQVYGELRRFLGSDCAPAAITDAVAGSYVDSRLLCSVDSPSTRRRKLSALKAFWEWMSSRGLATKGVNPWRGFRVPSAPSTGSRPRKRPYTTDELVRLFSGSPSYPTLREVMALALFTGARIDELCSLRCSDVRLERSTAFVRIARSKTAAGERTIAVHHPIPFAVLRRRLPKGSATSSGQLFHELKGGGYDKRLSWHVGQAFRYHRNKQGLGGETDFHSLRRTFITRAENLSVDQVHIARYVGHSLPTLAFKVYSGGATEATQLATAKAINYPTTVEKAVRQFAEI